MALLAGEGVPIRTISDHAGHEETRTTEANICATEWTASR